MQQLGYIAAILTISSFWYQLMHLIKVSGLTGVSIKGYSLLLVSTLCWLLYGIFILSAPIILSAAITCTFAGAILVMRLMAARQNSNRSE